MQYLFDFHNYTLQYTSVNIKKIKQNVEDGYHQRVEQNEAERITERINRSYCLFNYGEIRISHWVAVFA